MSDDAKNQNNPTLNENPAQKPNESTPAQAGVPAPLPVVPLPTSGLAVLQTVARDPNNLYQRIGPKLTLEEMRAQIENRPLPTNVYDPKADVIAPHTDSTFAPAIPTIEEIAATLGNNVDSIYQFVYNNIEFLAVNGSQKGALACFIDGYGNAFDQSALMVALLRASGYTAQFVFGWLKLNAAQCTAWLGVAGTGSTTTIKNQNTVVAAGNLLANGGFPAVFPYPYTSVTFDHVWVKVDVSGAGDWYVFDPSFKTYNVVAGMDIKTLSGYTDSAFQSACLPGVAAGAKQFQNISTSGMQTQLQNLYNTLMPKVLAAKPDATVLDLIGGRTIIPVTGSVRNTSLSYQDPSFTPIIWTDIPAAYLTTLQVQYDTITATFNSQDIATKRLTLIFNSSNQAELRCDGALVATSSAQTPGSPNDIYFTVTHPFAGPSFPTWKEKVIAGTYCLIAQAWGNANPQMAYIRQQLLRDNVTAGGADSDDDVIGESLNMRWHHWNAQKSAAAKMIGQLNNCTTVLYHQVGLVGHGASPTTDLGGIAWHSSANDNDYTRSHGNDVVLSLRGVSFEAGSIAQIPAVGGVSSNTVLGAANAAGQIIFTTTSADWSTIQPQLTNYSPADLATMTSYINNGYTLVVHQNGQTTQNDYSGYGYYAVTAPGGFGGGAIGIITGTLLGGQGDSTQPISDTNTNAVFNVTPPDNLDRVEIGEKTEVPVDFVVDHYTGNLTLRHTDIAVGSVPYPYSLPFTRTFNNRDVSTVSEVGRTWWHNYYITATIGSDPYAALSTQTAGSAAYNVLGTLVALSQMNNNTNNSIAVTLSWITADQITKLLTNNVVKIRDGERTYTFTALSDGTYLPPKGVNISLTKAVDHFVMTTFDGVVYKFTNWIQNTTRIETITFPTGVVLTFTYGGLPPEHSLTSVTSNTGRSLTFAYHLYYGAIPYLKSVTADNGAMATYVYDAIATGNLTQTVDAGGVQSNYAYDSKYRLLSYSRLGSYSVTYNAQNQVASLSNPAYTTLFEYLGTRGTYGAISRSSGGPDGTVATTFNADGQPISLQVGGDLTSFQYDGLGRTTSKTLPYGDTITYYYDQFNRVTNQYHGPQTETFSYGSAPNSGSFNKWSTRIDPNGKVWVRTYTSGGSIMTETDPNGGVKQYSYGVFDLPAGFTDPSGVFTSYTTLANGDLTQQIVNPGTGQLNLTTNYGHNYNGDVSSVTNPRGYSTGHDFNSSRWKIRTTETAPYSFQTNYGYDYVGNLIGTSRDTGFTLAQQTTSTTYILLNKPVTITDPLGNVTSFGYDAYGRRTSTLDAESHLRQYVLDGNGRLYQIIDANGVAEETRGLYPGGPVNTITDARGNKSTFQRDYLARLTELDFPNGTSEKFTLDANGNVTTFTTRAGKTIVQTFDGCNRVLTRTPASQPKVTFTYDAAGRLLTASKPVVAGDASSGTFSRAYDTAGRLSSETDSQSAVIAYELDANGNVT
ncbi:MAG: hypothetical protein KGS72_27535, partial [Cyanobacteria bacterium REEB67]|nr:hypothetical protein [Cyanobacteria bacterium REEB67]